MPAECQMSAPGRLFPFANTRPSSTCQPETNPYKPQTTAYMDTCSLDSVARTHLAHPQEQDHEKL